MTAPTINIRKGVESDCESILQFIEELALYEKAPEAVLMTLEQLKQDGFGEKPAFQVLIAEDTNQEPYLPVGFALWFQAYSTWKGTFMYLEDLYVTSTYRGQGIGVSLLKTLAQIALENGYKRLRWQVLDWNQPARDFYQSIGATEMSDWVPCQFDDEQSLNEFVNSH
eukprot:TRINITY_DN10007_c0_g1_i1.p1 TRINITY_DN10007_c0_g1~~TRINITY_DN10007_c0_g1_i1.p1  ORF type:complete len:168 (+),score=36.59 TRINITY_DN10007_c0_g1_i1:45-548(+)